MNCGSIKNTITAKIISCKWNLEHQTQNTQKFLIKLEIKLIFDKFHTSVNTDMCMEGTNYKMFNIYSWP